MYLLGKDISMLGLHQCVIAHEFTPQLFLVFEYNLGETSLNFTGTFSIDAAIVLCFFVASMVISLCKIQVRCCYTLSVTIIRPYSMSAFSIIETNMWKVN